MHKNSQGFWEDKNQPYLLVEQKEQAAESSIKSILKNTNFEKNVTYFHIMGHEEPHTIRRKQIIEKHPEIKVLFGPDIMSAWLGVGIVLAQFWCIEYFKTSDWLMYLVSSYCIGAVLSHALHALMHDFTHYLCFESPLYNKLMAIFLNFGQGVPSAITFGRYHSDHHTFMNLPELDPDLPSDWELQHIRGPIRKFLFLICMPFFYSLRPLFVRPLKPNRFEILNQVSVVLCNFLIYKFMGPSALLWLLLSTYFGLSVHPLAAHLITEHYEFINRLETYNYLGIANFLILNLGYHTEHHDFPNVPWSRLPLVRKMAPEFYDSIPYHTNYTMALFAYIFDGCMGPFSRIVRRELKVNGKMK